LDFTSSELLCWLDSSLASADDTQTHVTYVCNGEHLFIENCNIRDLSDNSTCLAAYKV